MTKKCNGCGSFLQNGDKNQEGYVQNLEKNDICERCFRIKNYNDYKIMDKSNDDFIPILKEINETKELVIFLIDIFQMNQDLSFITKYIKNDILLVFTKRDILPLSISNNFLLMYNEYLKIPCIDQVIISSEKNYGLDELIEKIKKYKKGKRVYIVGYTNAGKSSLINKLIYHYSDIERKITTSFFPSTTIHTIEIPLEEDLILIDTPGILENGSIIDKINTKLLKKVFPKKEIKPITYQVKMKQFIYIDTLAMIELEDNNITLFFSNELKIERMYKEKSVNLEKHIIRVKKGEDIVILGLGFMKMMRDEVVAVYTIKGVSVYTRKSLIGETD